MNQPTPPPFQSATSHAAPTTSSGQPLPPTSIDVEYIRNPFSIAIEGIRSLFRFAKPVAIIFLILTVASAVTNFATSAADLAQKYYTTEESASLYDENALPKFDGISSDQLAATFVVLGGIFLIFFVTFIIATIIINGLRDVATAAAVNNQKISLGQAFSRLFKRLPGYIGLSLLVGVKIFLWSLLFIIPGIVMAVRYSLAGTAYFARDMKATDAIRYSTKITKDGWMTTFASYGWLNIVTLGFIQLLVQPGAQIQLFRQFDHLEQNGGNKPGAHGLSIAYVVLFFLLVGLSISGVASLMWIYAESI